MSFRLYDLVLITGIVQGLVASILMISSRQFQPHQKLLGLIVLVFITVILRALVYSMNWDEVLWARFLPLGLELFLPPLMYFYLCLITSVSRLQEPTRMKHLLLPMSWLMYDLMTYGLTIIQPDMAAQNHMADWLYYEPVNLLEDKLILLSTWFYLILGIGRFRTFNQHMKSLDLRQSQVLHRWLLQIVIWMTVLGVFLLLNNLIDLFRLWEDSRWSRWMGFNTYLAVTTYYLGSLGMRLQSPRLFEAIQSIKTHQHKDQASDYEQLREHLYRYVFDEQRYLDPDLNSQQVARALQVPAETLSFLLNRKLKTTFRDLLNQYRVTAVQEKIKQHTNGKPTTNSILDLALESGFNSQASFYRAFKKILGHDTPAICC